MPKEKQDIDQRKRPNPSIVRLPRVEKRTLDEWAADDNPAILRGIAMQCLSYADIAESLSISRAQLFRWRKKNETIRDAIELGRNEADAIIISTTFDSAVKGDPLAREQWWKYRIAKQPLVYEEEQQVQLSQSGSFTLPASTTLLDALIEVYKKEQTQYGNNSA